MAQREIRISKETKIRELLTLYPESAKILYEMGFDCLTCKGADEEPLKLAAYMHGYEPDELIRILKEKLARRRRKK